MNWRRSVALIPVLFVPACVATHTFVVWQEKKPVIGPPQGEFPLLQIKGKSVGIVPYAARDAQAAFFIPPSDQARVLKQLEAQHVPDDPNSLSSEVNFENGRVHVRLEHELAMGYIRTESWYDVDGKSIVPRFERQYLPTWTLLYASVVAIPVAIVPAAIVAPLIRRKYPLPRAATIAIVAAALFAIADVQLAGITRSLFIGAPIAAAAAFAVAKIKWTRRRQALAIIAIIVIDIVLAWSFGDIAGLVVLAEAAIVAVVAPAMLIEKSLNYALTTAPTTS